MDNYKLMIGLIRGEEIAYSLMVDYFHHKLCVYANSLTNNSEQAEDIVQNVFIRTYEKRKRLSPDKSLKSYLYRSVYNEFIDQYRKQQAVTLLEKKYIESLERVIQEDEDSFEKLLRLVRQEMERLPPKCKRIFYMSKEEGMTNPEIAEKLGISVKTVEAHISKAYATIREKANSKISMESILFLFFRNPTSYI